VIKTKTLDRLAREIQREWEGQASEDCPYDPATHDMTEADCEWVEHETGLGGEDLKEAVVYVEQKIQGII
jgi:hypothetical protein